MRRIILCAAALLVAGLDALTVRAADEADPKAALQGRWKMLSSNDPEIHGDRDNPNQVTLVIDGDNFTLTIANEGGTRELTGGYTFDPRPTPQTIDFMIRGDNLGTTVFGIYRISGDRLTIRWRIDDMRPGDFTSPKAEFDTTFVFKHEKE
jgi:uncharacterized protein (TIGR03067 family)